ncbi:MAG: SPOR domain-containing protein [Gammaproteobacteria bacterium]|nr:SPOR domain-containing protein [Gammaproteobacteria bacterium]MDH4256526.1 SPOR domain-containing protein [Gammaproteobacteria bacterium]MDH5310275.1 SPOR domain-containing protein [Gammaproteobacteria bacterium]
MRNLLLILLLANILYFLWGQFVERPPEQGVAIIAESELGPPLKLTDPAAGGVTSVGAVLGSGRSADLAAVVGRSCVSVGPFKDGAEADTAMGEFVADGMRSSLRTTQGQVFVGHWVQIRNVPSRDDGNAMIAKLKEGGLGDAYMVETEDEGLKISLGLFGEVERAERIELQAESLGLEADISPRTRDATVFFVDIGLPPGRGATAIVEKYGEEKVLLRDAATCPR